MIRSFITHNKRLGREAVTFSKNSHCAGSPLRIITGGADHEVLIRTASHDAGVRGTIEACRLEAREPAGVRLGGRGDAV